MCLILVKIVIQINKAMMIKYIEGNNGFVIVNRIINIWANEKHQIQKRAYRYMVIVKL